MKVPTFLISSRFRYTFAVRFPQFSHVPRNNFNFYPRRSPIFPSIQWKILSDAFYLALLARARPFHWAFRCYLSETRPFFSIPFSYSYGIMIMTISAIVETSVNSKSSGSYKLNETRAGMHQEYINYHVNVTRVH